MSDVEFERFLGAALAPPERDEDLAFAGRVQQRLRLERMLDVERAGIRRRLWLDLTSVSAVSLALLALAQAPGVAALAIEQGPVILTALFLGFAGWLSLSRAGESRYAAFS